MTNETKPKTLQLADVLESYSSYNGNILDAASELRRLHDQVEVLQAERAALVDVGWFKYDKVSQCWHPQHEEYAEKYAAEQGWRKLYLSAHPEVAKDSGDN